eukprot:6172055-Pleurochrysis_carterae.AAC.2
MRASGMNKQPARPSRTFIRLRILRALCLARFVRACRCACFCAHAHHLARAWANIRGSLLPSVRCARANDWGHTWLVVATSMHGVCVYVPNGNCVSRPGAMTPKGLPRSTDVLGEITQ